VAAADASAAYLSRAVERFVSAAFDLLEVSELDLSYDASFAPPALSVSNLARFSSKLNVIC
jgi:S-adenosylmethionine synthetase